MPDTKLMTGRDLGKAICAHFGLNINQVQSDYRIKTDLNGLASINLTISLTPDDLAGIARAAGADGVQTFTATGHFCKPSPVATVAVDAETSETLRCYGGSAKADSRLDEVVSLLKQLVDHAKRERAARYMTVAPVCIVEPGA
ncbi:hypothetical protein ACSBPU_12840 [Parapusillimonas sp. JC17]|uniref:hypothetical protein n=1 Tax=Parapusillimonas sp. JC17 TaxID=3445768 RepID=UPI003FA18C6A